MKTEPPPKRPPPAVPLRQLNGVISGTLAAIVAILGVVSTQGEDQTLAQVMVQIPVPSGSALTPLVAGVGFVALSGLFAMCESAMSALKPHHLKRVADQPGMADRLQERLRRRAEIVAALSFGDLLARVGVGFCGLLLTLLMAAWIERGQGRGVGYDSLALSALAVVIPAGIFRFVFGVFLPRSLGNAYPLAISLRLGGVIEGTLAILGVPARLLVGISEGLRRRVGPKMNEVDSNMEKEEEIRTLVDSAEESGALEEDERELIRSAFEFSDTVAREVMTPRTDLESMPITSDPSVLADLIETTGHSRIPLYEETDDNIIGILLAKDLLLAMVHDKNVDVRTLMRPPIFVSEGKPLHAILREMRAAHAQLVVVQDEFGGTAGIVTLEDIIEELVGEIQDEYDSEDEEVSETPTGYLIEGTTHIDDLNEQIGTRFSSEDFHTIGGFAFGLFGRQPKPGEEIIADGFRFTIAETDGRRITKLRLEPATRNEV